MFLAANSLDSLIKPLKLLKPNNLIASSTSLVLGLFLSSLLIFQ